MILIGIDPGVQTGFAVTVDGVFTQIETYSFWEAIYQLNMLGLKKIATTVYIEDPNYNKPVFIKRGANARGYLRIAQNVGSNKRDAQLIIEYCERNKIPCTPVAPLKGGYHKPDADMFYKITGCRGRTSQHARDAAMLIFGRKF